MASGKMSPRQKMINMMYLVLIALLALNVSKKILKAFNLIENSFESSKKNLDGKNEAVMKAISKEAETNPAYKIWVTKSQQAHQISQEFCKKIEEMRLKLEKDADGRKPDDPSATKIGTLNELQMPDNMEKHANYFAEGPGKQGQGKVLQKFITDTRNNLLNVLNDPQISNNAAIRTKFETATGLKADDPKGGEGGSHNSWVGMYLEHSPLAGVMTMLNKYENDCKNLESDILNELSLQVHAKEFKFDQLAAKLIPTKGTVVLEGDPYEAEIILLAYNSQQKADMSVNGSPIEVKDGVGKYKMTARVGNQKVKALVKVPEPGGGFKTYDVESEYMGFKSSATISAEKMNVLYAGLDNPIKVSVPGFAPEAVTPIMQGGGSLTGSMGNYMAVVPVGIKEVTIAATVKTKDGSKQMGSVRFRVKNVPKPIATFGTKAGGPVKDIEVKSTNYILCGLGPEFAYEGLNYSVTKYSLIYVPKRGDALPFTGQTGNVLTPTVKQALSRCKKGDQIVVFSIEAMGPQKVGLVKLPTAIALQVE